MPICEDNAPKNKFLFQYFSIIAYYTKFFYSKFGVFLFLFIILSFISTGLDVIGLTVVVVVIQKLSGQNSIGENQDLPVEIFFDLISTFGFENSMKGVLLALIVIFILKGLGVFILGYLSAVKRNNLMIQLRVDIFKYSMSLGYDKYSERKTSDYMSLINEQITETVSSFMSFVNFYTQLIAVCFLFFSSLYIDISFTIIAFVGFLFTFPIYAGINERIDVAARENLSTVKQMNLYGLQGFRFNNYIRATDTMNVVVQPFHDSVQAYGRSHKSKAVLMVLSQCIREPLAILMIAGVIILLSELERLQDGGLILAVLLFYRIIMALTAVQVSVQALVSRFPFVESVSEAYDLFVETRVPALASSLDTWGQSDFSTEIRLEKVDFSYGSRENVIREVSFSIAKNKRIVLVGASGAGKSTLLNLLMRFITPTNGSIMVDQHRLEAIPLATWRNRLGYVSQEPVVFQGTVLENIALQPASSAEISRVWEKLGLVGLTDLVEALPQGLNSEIGDFGSSLSAGQRQRLAIARELYKDPWILILDEITSALDPKTESEVEKSISALHGRVTIVEVTHRLSSASNSDLIVVLSSGQVVELGTYDELTGKSSSVFNQLRFGKGLSS